MAELEMNIKINGAVAELTLLQNAITLLIGGYNARNTIVGALNPDKVKVLSMSIEELLGVTEATERARNSLARARVTDVAALLTKTEDDLVAITGFGMKSLDTVIAALDQHGLILPHIQVQSRIS